MIRILSRYRTPQTLKSNPSIPLGGAFRPSALTRFASVDIAYTLRYNSRADSMLDP